MSGLRKYSAFLLLISFGFAACISIFSPQEKQVQGWDKKRGPVVPHDKFPRDCSICHATGSWNKIKADFRFDHEKETGVALKESHREAQCLRCHNDRGPVANYAVRGCAGCHEDIHQGKLGNACTDCHQETTWQPVGLVSKHNRTRFPLIGSHLAVACDRCHPGAEVGNFANANPTCANCHQVDLAAATSPNHAALGWTSNCQSCHRPTIWTGSGFTHSKFPLTGAHATAACTQCHTGGVFSGLSQNCYSCHASEYNATTDPNHAADGLSTNCQNCHNTSTWQGAHFSHAGITSGCNTCHATEYGATSNPNHAATGIPTTCQNCHNTSSWLTVHFSHSGITSGCSGCHLANYNATTNPNHAATGIPTTCQNCHNTTTWSGAVFNHSGITTGCYNCHSAEYNATTNPNHISSGYPTSCEICHFNTTTWNGAVFNHTFNIQSGPHHSLSCQQCHTIPNNYSVASCIPCHSQSETNSEHNGVQGYQYNSAACIACHPTGSGN